jgi:ABC-type oligopeptide transport system ATPase subunit
MNVIKANYNKPIYVPVPEIIVPKVEKEVDPVIKGPPNNEVKCAYDFIPKKYIVEYDNPNIKHHGLKIPFRMAIIGSSGSGKTQLVLHIIDKMRNTFGNIKIFTKDQDEPIYNFLKDRIPRDQLQIYNGISELTDLNNKDMVTEAYDPKMQHLVIFDDLVLMKDQHKIQEYYIRGRKIAKGISLMYLSQSYFGIPSVIRKNLTYLILKKLANESDLNRILREYSLGCSKEYLMQTYQDCTNEKTNFLLINIDGTREDKFKKNLLEVIPPEVKIPKTKASKNNILIPV